MEHDPSTGSDKTVNSIRENYISKGDCSFETMIIVCFKLMVKDSLLLLLWMCLEGLNEIVEEMKYIYVLKRRKTRKGEVWNLNGSSKKRGPSSISIERLRVALFIEGMIWTKNITKQNSLSADSRNGGVQKHFTILVIYETNLVTLQFVFHSFLSLSSYFSSLNKLLWSKGKREKNWNWIPVK